MFFVNCFSFPSGHIFAYCVVPLFAVGRTLNALEQFTIQAIVTFIKIHMPTNCNEIKWAGSKNYMSCTLGSNSLCWFTNVNRRQLLIFMHILFPRPLSLSLSFFLSLSYALLKLTSSSWSTWCNRQLLISLSDHWCNIYLRRSCSYPYPCSPLRLDSYDAEGNSLSLCYQPR